MYLCKGRHNRLMLLQLKELADEVLFCKTQRLQLTEDLFKYLQTQKTQKNLLYISMQSNMYTQ